MLLTIDVGNTNITMGVFREEGPAGNVPYDDKTPENIG